RADVEVVSVEISGTEVTLLAVERDRQEGQPPETYMACYEIGSDQDQRASGVLPGDHGVMIFKAGPNSEHYPGPGAEDSTVDPDNLWGSISGLPDPTDGLWEYFPAGSSDVRTPEPHTS